MGKKSRASPRKLTPAEIDTFSKENHHQAMIEGHEFSSHLDEVVRKIDHPFDFSRIREAADEIEAKCPFTHENRQISLKHQRETVQDPRDGVGPLQNIYAPGGPAFERDFRFFRQEFRNSYLREFAETIEASLSIKLGRIRLMNLPGRRCYSLHQDRTVRYHFVLKTNPQAIFVFPRQGVFHLPADGFLYRVDTRHTHSVMNGALSDRVHLVFNEAESS